MTTHVPKKFITGIRVPWGPFAGRLADQCICGYETSLDEIFEDEGTLLWLVEVNGHLRFCHEECIPGPKDHNDA